MNIMNFPIYEEIPEYYLQNLTENSTKDPKEKEEVNNG